VKKYQMITLLVCLSMSLTSCQSVSKTKANTVNAEALTAGEIADSTQSTLTTTGTDIDFATPEQYLDEFTNDSGKLIVHVDAPVFVPKTSALPVIKVAPRNITQEEVDQLVLFLFQGKPLLGTRSSKELTVTELQEAIEEYTAAAAVETNPDQKQSLLDSIEAFEGLLKDAPESIQFDEANTTLQGTEGQTAIEVFCDLDHVYPASIFVGNGVDDRAQASFMNGSDLRYGEVLSPDDAAYGLKISFEDAKTSAEAAVKILDPNGEYSLSTYGISWADQRSLESEETADLANAPKAYVFEYMRQVNGIPATYTETDCDSLKSMEDTTTNPMLYERIQVQVDENGIVDLIWNSPMTQGEVVTPNAQILSFSQVQELFEKMIKLQYSYVDADNPGYTINSCDVYVTRVVLGYTRIASKDNPEEFVMVPVWDFFGYAEQNIEGNPSSEKSERMAYSYSLLTINAIDGSVIDRGFGY